MKFRNDSLFNLEIKRWAIVAFTVELFDDGVKVSWRFRRDCFKRPPTITQSCLKFDSKGEKHDFSVVEN